MHRDTLAHAKRFSITSRPFAIGAITTLLLSAVFYTGTQWSRAADREKSTADIAKLATALTDLEATIKVTKYDSAELEKIGSDLKTTYSLRNVNFQYKQPDKIRIEAKSQTRGSALLIMNGATRYYEVPKLKIKKSENLESHPGKRQSLLEYAGLVSTGTLEFMDATMLREEKLGDRSTIVYNLRFQGEDKGSYYRVWIDKDTHVTVKREWRDGADKLRATFLYSDLKEIAQGIWMPTKVEVKNAEGVSAAQLSMTDIKPNQGLTDALFTPAP
jgi:outer membrane lipoprotein-sorting protein